MQSISDGWGGMLLLLMVTELTLKFHDIQQFVPLDTFIATGLGTIAAVAIGVEE